MLKNRNWTFPVLRFFSPILKFVSDILASMVVLCLLKPKSYKFKANNNKIDPFQFCLKSISTKFDYFKSGEISFKADIFDFSVDVKQLINLTYYYLFLVKLDRCDGSCNTGDNLSSKIYVPNNTKNVNLTLIKRFPCNCKSKFNGRIMESVYLIVKNPTKHRVC